MTFDVDEVGRLHQRTDDAQTTTIGYDPKGNIASFTRTGKPPATFGYDARDRFTTEIVGTQTTTYGYDDNSALASLTNARNKKTIYAQSGFGDSRGTTNAISVTTAQTTDAAGRPVDTKVIKKTADGKTLVLRWSKQEFDPLGRVTRQIRKLFTSPLELPTNGTDPSGATDVISRTIYDDAARKVTVIDPRGNATVSEMDELGRLLRVTDAIGNTLEYEYDANNNKHSETMSEVAPDGKKEATRVVYDYDEQNRMVARTDVTNPATPLDTRFGYDQQGNMTSQTDPDGRTTRFEYDLRRRMTKKTDAMGGVTKYVYDDADRIQSVTDANQNQTTFTYDTDGNLLTEKRADGATWSYTYDENFNRKTVTDPNGTVVTFIYDDADRLVEKQIAKGTNVAGPSRVTVTLDDLDRTVGTSTDEGVAETFAFDSLDRPLNESLQIGSGPKRTFVRAFDPAGNVVGLTYPSGLQLTYDIDKIDRIAAIRDAASPATPVVAYTDIGGRPSTKTFANGVTETWNYDPNRRLAEILSKVPNATLRDVQYERSRAGDKLSAIRPDLGKKSVFTYNANHWMTNESTGVPLTGINPQPALSVDYDIDPVLNMRSIARSTNATSGTTSTATSFSINSRNQYTASGTEPLSYDRNGNLTSRTGLVMQYDHENHLRKATLTGGATIENLYDVSGRKVEQKVADGGTTHITDYALSGQQANEEYLDGTLANRYVHGREIDEKVRAEISSGTFYPLLDELGNAERVTDAAGATVERYGYEGYGHFTVFNPSDVQLATGNLGWKWLFQGREYQPVLGAFDFRARTLWPDLERFGEEDPAQAHSEYSSYAAFLGSPISLIDPTGEYEEDVHHYLTIFLARGAGFDPKRADLIGYHTGHLDYDLRDAMTIPIGPFEVTGPNVANYERYHFVTEYHLEELRKEAMKYPENFTGVGEYLHALEDSYSHQANPTQRDFSAQYDDAYVLGHGLHHHDPDWTWTRPPLAMLMAEEVHMRLTILAGQYDPSVSKLGTYVPWSQLKATVAAFVNHQPTSFFMESFGPVDVPSVGDYQPKVNELAGYFKPVVPGEFRLGSYETEPRRLGMLQYQRRQALAARQAARDAENARARWDRR
jgi:RHS repeat-associated protein